VKVPAIETCSMSIDEILVARILSKSRSTFYKRRAQYEEILPSPRSQSHEEDMKKYEEA